MQQMTHMAESIKALSNVQGNNSHMQEDDAKN
jgi:hypothetical protein